MMRRLSRRAVHLAAALGLLLASAPSQAHLMADQHGTINFANGGAFLVLSVPVSAFEGVDDDGDGLLSAEELGLHVAEVEQQIQSGVRLLDHTGDSLPLQGLLLSLAPPDDAPGAPAKYLVVLGRFPAGEDDSSLVMQIALQGEAPQERHFEVTTTRNAVSRTLTFAPGHDRHAL